MYKYFLYIFKQCTFLYEYEDKNVPFWSAESQYIENLKIKKKSVFKFVWSKIEIIEIWNYK